MRGVKPHFMRKRAWPCFPVIPVIFACALCTLVKTDAEEMVQISSSIVIDVPEVTTEGTLTSNCVEGNLAYQSIQSALNNTYNSLMFVPTALWFDNRTSADEKQSTVGHFCLGKTNSGCEEPTLSQIEAFTFDMAACFQLAVQAGLDLVIYPQLSPINSLSKKDADGNAETNWAWSNGILADPLKQYGNWSYAEFFLYPLADALASVISPTTRVRFNIQRQMSASVVYYPSSHYLLLTLLKDRLLRSTTYARQNVQVGIAMTGKMCYCVLHDVDNQTQYLQQLPQELANYSMTSGIIFDKAAIAKLFEAADFIGVTSYPQLEPNFTTQQLEKATEDISEEMALFGVNLDRLNTQQGKQLFWNEIGVGGANSTKLPASTAEEVARNPYYPVYGDYKSSLNPWQSTSNQTTPVQSYRRYFYQQLRTYASQIGKNSQFRYQVAGIYLTSVNSYDVLGINAHSYLNYTSQANAFASNESYKDPTISEMINDYNMQATSN